MSRDVALIYAGHLDNSVLFEITIECNHVLIPYIKLNKNFSFSNDENEILFTVGTVFQVESVHRQELIWNIKLILNRQTYNQTTFTSLKTYIDKTSIENNFIKFLLQTDPYSIENYNEIKAILNELSSNSVEIISFYITIGLLQRHYKLELVYYQKAITFLTDHIRLKSYIYRSIGIICHNQYDYKTALEYYYKAIKLNLQSNDISTVYLYSKIGDIYECEYNYQLSLENYLKAIDICNSDHYHLLIADICEKIAYMSNEHFSNTDMSLNYFKKSVISRHHCLTADHPSFGLLYENIAKKVFFIHSRTIEESYEKTVDLVTTNCLSENHFSLVWLYEKLGNLYEKQSKYTIAANYYQKAINACLTMNNVLLIFLNEKIGDVYEKMSVNDMALRHYKIATESGMIYLFKNHSLFIRLYEKIAIIYEEVECNYPLAIKFYLKLHDVIDDIKNLHSVYDHLFRLHIKNNDYRNSLAYLEKKFDLEINSTEMIHSTIETCKLIITTATTIATMTEYLSDYIILSTAYLLSIVYILKTNDILYEKYEKKDDYIQRTKNLKTTLHVDFQPVTFDNLLIKLSNGHNIKSENYFTALDSLDSAYNDYIDRAKVLFT
ncbi:unnamed protein product [Didymodactylos carnosus]|uniref:Uncharacterized protein n=1 Tax=Didymodactylos carnosus TaxID=1234261 RepID=A0A8S2TAU7_9BILA|nr:unnamed protein product [Didymodactylos carnosus]CAF4271020.1 unnamed protein product [Didymodactylos carnosus]